MRQPRITTTQILLKTILILATYYANSQIAKAIDFQKMDMYLITMGPAEPFYSGAGHTLLRVKTPDFDKVFNWGVFAYHQKGFILNFLKGVALYKMEYSNSSRYLSYNRAELPRYVIQDEINLTAKQKQQIWKEIEWWKIPENQYYKYHSWKDNCSTKVRDILDKALGRKIKTRLKNITSSTTIRDILSIYFGEWPAAALIIDIVSNGEIDIHLTEWELMFAPELLRKNLLDLPAISDSGVYSKNESLLRNNKIIDHGRYWKKNHPNYYLLLYLLFFAPISLALVIKTNNSNSKTPKKIIGFSLIIFGIVSGLLGLIMTALPAISLRTYLYFNANLWLFWPLDFNLIITGTYWLFGSEIRKKPLIKSQKMISLLHIFAGLIFFTIAITGQIAQNTMSSLAVLLPITVSLHGLHLIILQKTTK